jgi:hypothetical protein
MHLQVRAGQGPAVFAASEAGTLNTFTYRKAGKGRRMPLFSFAADTSSRRVRGRA